MNERPLTILFMPESAYGPTNNCIGIGDVLRRRERTRPDVIVEDNVVGF